MVPCLSELIVTFCIANKIVDNVTATTYNRTLMLIFSFYLVMMQEQFLDSLDQVSLTSFCYYIEKYIHAISNHHHNELLVIGLVAI